MTAIASIGTVSMAHSLEIGKTIHGFTIRASVALPDIDGTMWRMEHAKTGADLIWLERADENRTFAIAFKTPPDDSTGVAHIMEHSVLCGSEKFPIKEPFVELLKSSMATFLNAMTGSDATSYPVASKNDRDFLNLSDVYLDAVFHPLSVKDDWALRQEGWHYEYDGTNLTRNGIVYSEMKANFSDPENVGEERLNQLLYPDNTYGKCSGGDPAHIPELTFAKYRAFHERFYHPSNARILLDGKVPLDASLALANRYLSAFEHRQIAAEIPYQRQVTGADTIRYASDNECRKTMLMDGWVFSRFDDCERDLTMDVVSEVLVGSNDAPLKRALLDAGLCEDVSLYCYGGHQLTAYLQVKNTDPAQAAQCRKVVRDTISRCCREGLDRKRISAILDKLEYRYRENDRAQRGLHYFFTIRGDWMYGGDPTQRLRLSPLFAKLRQRNGTGWYEQVLKEAILDNPHHAEVTMVPSKSLAAEQHAAEIAELKRIKESMGAEKLAQIAVEASAIKAKQSVPDRTEDIAKLPRLRLSDIPRNAAVPKWTEGTLDGVTVIRPDVKVDGIFYLDLVFALDGLSDEELTDLPFLASVLGKLATHEHSALELKNELDAKLGHFDIETTSYRYGAKLTIRVAALNSRWSDAIRLVREIALNTRFDDADAITKLRKQGCDQWERKAGSWGGSIANARAEAAINGRCRVAELFGGVTQLRRMQGEFRSDLGKLAQKVFVRNRLLVSATDKLSDNSLRETIAIWPQGANAALSTAKPGAKASEGYETEGTVGFLTMATQLPEGVRFNGAHRVAERIISLEYLWNEIRVKGGAYGGAMRTYRDGGINFSSWRDPNPARSFEIFSGAGKALGDFVVAGNSIEKYQVSAYSRTDQCQSPRQQANTTLALYLNRISAENIIQMREEILNTTPASLGDYAATLTQAVKNPSKCAFANRKLLAPCKLDRTEKITAK